MGARRPQCGTSQPVPPPTTQPAGPPRRGKHDKMRKGSRDADRSTFWLPSPGRAGGDREEPHRSHGFVDRAYLVFLTTCCQTSTHQRDTGYDEASLTPFSLSPPSPGARPTGYEPLKAATGRVISFEPWRSSGNRPRMEVRDSRPTARGMDPFPSRVLLQSVGSAAPPGPLYPLLPLSRLRAT